LDDIFSEAFTPSDEDILKLRTVTMAISHSIFIVKNVNFHFFDVSGLKHHRKSWIAYFDNVDVVLFVTSLSSYDQVMVEDPLTNRMLDSIMLFGKTVNNPLLKDKSFLIFLNKKDVYEKKVAKVAISDYFPQYSGIIFPTIDKNYSANRGCEFFKKRFQLQIQNEAKQDELVFHVTCCTDTKSMGILITAVTYIDL
jgi:hypothetical protein